ncbi:MFS transporter [Actinomadura verrucosospora]|uniref:Permease tetracycline resistance determinant n=1 Tax=Actinomadura verrucosospora TaxID=46165 RepID=A0A7D3VUU5_ACTVE|nr:MFS transporter [Actinomadura verrucosospora]QKG23238.1 permease; tetracycline resistance determinant [Actinomadura verrucosospora]
MSNDVRDGRRAWRDFRLLWGGQSVSLLGDQVFLLALPLTALQELHAGTLQIALVAALGKLPFLLIGLPAGVWVARLGMRRSMLGADLVRAVAVLSLPAAAWAGALTLPHLLLAALVTGVGMVFFQVAYQSYAPALITDDGRLHAANTRLSLSESTALLAGPGIAGAVVTALGAVRALLTDASSYTVSVLTLALIRHREPPPPPAAEGRSLRRDVGDGLRFVARHPVLRPIMVCGALYNLGVAMYDSLIAVFGVRYLGLHAWALGAALALGGAGFPLGSLIARRVAARAGIGPSLTLAGVPSVVGLAVGAAASGPWPAVVLAAGTFVNGVGQGVFAVNAITIRHLATPPDLATRATAVHRFLTWGALPVGSAIAGVVGSASGLRAAMLTAAATAALCMIPLRSRALLRTRAVHRTPPAVPEPA